MHLDGSHLIRGTRQAVWDALHDPAVLVTTIPGCLELREEGPDAYLAKVEAGIASLTGVYEGRVALREQAPPSQYVLTASGQGGPGTIEATVRIDLREADGGTLVTYDAEAIIGGAIAGVGQRVVAGVAKRSAAQFFTAVDAHVMGEGPATAATTEAAGVSAASGVGEAAQGVRVHRRPTPPAAAGQDAGALLVAAAVGAAIALLGVLVGSRRRR